MAWTHIDSPNSCYTTPEAKQHVRERLAAARAHRETHAAEIQAAYDQTLYAALVASDD